MKLLEEDLGGYITRATGVSADGSTIVGYSQTANGREQAFRWTAADGMEGLGGLPRSDGFVLSEAIAISADGLTA
jgi:probable HAF family extracellular repeat protein